MSTVNPDQIRDSLMQCMDPEVPLSIVDMGLIYGIDVAENNNDYNFNKYVHFDVIIIVVKF